jgi:predicted lipoprotein with Yx(FWY)xxD motif
MYTWMTRWLTIGVSGLLLVSAIVPAARAAPAQQAAPQILVADNAKYGPILVDSQQHTLYILTAETNTVIKCADKCLTFWPPLTVPAPDAKPAAAEGVTGELGTVARPDSNPQITYNGYPLYRYYQDKAPGDTNGQGTQFAGGMYTVVRAINLAATPAVRLAVHVTSSGGIVWGRVTARFTYQQRETQDICASASCQFAIPAGVMVRLTQSPTNPAIRAFKTWRIKTSGTQAKPRTVTKPATTLRMKASYRVKAVYAVS